MVWFTQLENLMSSLVCIAKISPSSSSQTGLLGYLRAAEEFAHGAKIHSGQDVVGVRQEDDQFFLLCPDDQDFLRAENSARMLESYVRPHVVYFMDGQPSFPMRQSGEN